MFIGVISAVKRNKKWMETAAQMPFTKRMKQLYNYVVAECKKQKVKATENELRTMVCIIERSVF